MMKPSVIGYVRQEISGNDRLRDQTAIQELADRWGYDLLPVVIIGPGVPAPTLLLVQHIRESDAAAVIVPSKEHIWSARRAVTELCDLIAVDSEEVWKRGHHWPPVESIRGE